MKRKKNVVIRKSTSTKKEALTDETPEKSIGTFSLVDSTTVGNRDIPVTLENIADRLATAVLTEKKIDISLIDDRAPIPPIPTPKFDPKINVAAPEVNVNVNPTPFEIRVPTQRISAPPAPDVKVVNNVDLSHLVFIGYAHLLVFIIGVIVWLSRMLLNLPL